MKHRQRLEKIRIRFKATKQRHEYWNDELHLLDQQTVLVHPGIAKRLIQNFSDNFEKVRIQCWKIGKQLRRPLKLSEISLVSIVNKPDVFEKNLKPSIPRGVETIIIDNEGNKKFSSASKALNYGIKQARNTTIITCHQDIQFGKGWFDALIKQECRLRNWGALGIVGTADGVYRLRWGYDFDRPKKAEILDECVFIVNKRNGLTFDEKNFDGWHQYGSDFSLQCHDKGFGVFILAGECFHRWFRGKRPGWLAGSIPYLDRIRQKWSSKFSVINTTVGEVK